jgi:perosamine synthetase
MEIRLNRPTIRRREMDAVLTTMVQDRIGPGSEADELCAFLSQSFGFSGGIALRTHLESLFALFHCLGLEAGQRVLTTALSPQIYRRACELYGLELVVLDVQDGMTLIDSDALRSAEAELILLEEGKGFYENLEFVSEFNIPVAVDTSYTGSEERYKGLVKFLLIRLESDNLLTSGGGTVVLGAGRKEYSFLKKYREMLSNSELLADINAALAVSMLKNIESGTSKLAELKKLFLDAAARSSHQVWGDESLMEQFALILDGNMNDASSYARKKGIETKAHFSDALILHSEDPERWPNALNIALRTIDFPFYPFLGKSEADAIIKVISTLP